MSWFSDLFKEKKTTLTPDKEDWQMRAGKAVSDWATKYISQYNPAAGYGGEFTAPMTKAENVGQDWLMKYLDQPATGEHFKLASDEVKKTLSGGYDPYNSDYYKAMRSGAKYEMEDAIDEMRRGQGARGTYFQDTSIREENKLRERGSNALMQILGDLYERERERKSGAVTSAMQLEDYEQGAGLRKTAAASSYGSLPRLIEQSDLEAKYQDFLRKQDALSGSVEAAQNAFGTSINYGVKEYESPSPFERIMSSAGRLAGQIAPYALAPATGGLSLAAAPLTSSQGQTNPSYWSNLSPSYFG